MVFAERESRETMTINLVLQLFKAFGAFEDMSRTISHEAACPTQVLSAKVYLA